MSDEEFSSSEDISDFFDHVKEPNSSLISKIKVDELLQNDRDLLAYFYVAHTALGTAWYKFQNMNGLIEYSPEYWKQLDMNRVAHIYHSMIKRIGEHRGDCTHHPWSCDRCTCECSYLKVMKVYHEAVKLDITLPTLISILLSRDKISIINQDNHRRLMTPLDEESKKHKEKYLHDWIQVANKAYPPEREIDLKKYIDHWITLDKDEINFNVARAEQIRAWCDEVPICPGVPWW